jgi:pimeloyl-ACP methyl ester carboxylesterase
MYDLGREFVAFHRVGYRDEPSIPGDREWERRFIQDLWMTEELLRGLEKQGTPGAHAAGLRLRGFISQVDSSLQCYRIFVPSACKDATDGLPLTIVLPTLVSAEKPFLESAFMRDYDQANRMAAMAELHKTMILWPGYHNQPTGSALEPAYLGEVLEAVAKEYKVAEDRITLMGICTGAAMAFDACANWPGRFAGIALLNPIFGVDRKVPKEIRGRFKAHPDFSKWLIPSGVSAYLLEKTPPVFLINDGGEPGHGEIRRSLEFSVNAVNARAPVEFQIRPHAEAKHARGLQELVQWASGQKLPGGVPAGGFKRLRKGNIQDALTEKFIVIEGSMGTTEENAANNEIARAIVNAWQRTHFSPCNTMKDKDAGAPETQGCNLVLIGNERTNSVWKSLARKLNLRIGPDAITLGDKTWRGEDVSIQTVVPNPFDEKQKVILVGGWNPGPKSFGTLNLSNDGWFKRAVWKNAGGEAILLDCASSEQQ